MSKYTGRIIRSKDLVQEFREKELTRRRFVRGAATFGAALPLASALPGCVTTTRVDDDDDTTPTNHLVGMATGDQYTATLRAALDETVGRNQLEFIQPGDTVYLKVNSNSGDYYPYSTRPKMVERMTGHWSGEPIGSLSATVPSGATLTPTTTWSRTASSKQPRTPAPSSSFSMTTRSIGSSSAKTTTPTGTVDSAIPCR